MSIETINAYLSGLSAFRDFERVKRERDEALRQLDEIKNRPVEVVKHVLEEMRKGESANFTKEELDLGLPEMIKRFIEERADAKSRVDQIANDYWRRREMEKK